MSDPSQFEEKPSIVSCPKCHKGLINTWEVYTSKGKPRRNPKLVASSCKCGYSVSGDYWILGRGKRNTK